MNHKKALSFFSEDIGETHFGGFMKKKVPSGKEEEEVGRERGGREMRK